MAQNVREIEITKCYDEHVCHDYTCAEIKVLPYEPDYEKFYKDYLLKNLPCIIKNTSINWECTKKWVKNDNINCDYFIQKYKDFDAPVADCDNIEYNAQCKTDVNVCDFMEYLKNKERDKLLYLKDWHLRKLQPMDGFYEVPAIFSSDWLNEYAQDLNEDDFMFVYIGPKNSWTPLHADVYNSYSWSVNIVGCKKWILFPPGEEEKLKNSLGNLPLLFDPQNFQNIKYFEITQEKNDAIFVPSGWHHQVINQLDTISVNHNWVNACNVEAVWKALENTLLSVEHEIENLKDVPEFATQCQLILKSLFGMDFETFINFICYIAKKRLNQLLGENHVAFNNYKLGENHIKFDLNSILKIINLFNKHPLIVDNHLKLNYKYDIPSITQSLMKIN